VLAFGLLVTGVFVLHLHAKAKQSDRIAQAAQELRIANQRLETHAVEMAEQARLAALGSDMGVVLTQRVSLAVMLQSCAGVLVKHQKAACARIWTLSEDQKVLELQASAGMYTHTNGGHAHVPVSSFKIGNIAQDRVLHLSNNVIHDPEVSDPAWARREGMVAFAGYPLIVEDRLVGVAALFARKPLADSVLKALASIADEIALGIERKKAEEALRASEMRFRIAAENGSDVIVVRDLLKEQLFTSGAEQRLLPCARKMPRSFNEFQNLLHPEDRDRVKGAIEAHLHTGALYREKFRVIDEDGSIRHWSARGTAIRNASGKPTQLIVVTTDITEQKETEAALSHLAAIVESSEASILSIDLNGTILTWNPAAERIYWYAAEEVKGRSVSLI
jgi:PAS domain S-box-containing protein